MWKKREGRITVQVVGGLNDMTYQDRRAHECDVREEVARLAEARRLELQLATVGVQKVRIQDQAELRSCDEERRDKAPYLGQSLEGEELVRQEDRIVEVKEAHMRWQRERYGGRCQGSVSVSEVYLVPPGRVRIKGVP